MNEKMSAENFRPLRSPFDALPEYDDDELDTIPSIVKNTFIEVTVYQNTNIDSDMLDTALKCIFDSPFTEYTQGLLMSKFCKDLNTELDLLDLHALYKFIEPKFQAFRIYDKSHSGFLHYQDATSLLEEMGYNFEADFTGFILEKMSTSYKGIALDDFVRLCLFLEKAGTVFNEEDDLKLVFVQFRDFLELCVWCLP